MKRNEKEVKILVPDFTINENPDKTISDAKKLIEYDIMESLNSEMIKSLRNLWRIGDEAKKQTRKRSK